MTVKRQHKNNIKKTRYMRLVEKAYGKDVYDLLTEEYLHNKKTLRDIEAEFDIPIATLIKWFRLLDIPTRTLTFN